MVVDARSERTVLDDKLAKTLRAAHKPILLIANKCEGKEQTNALIDFYKLGLGDPIPVSAEHGLGLADLYQELIPLFPESEESSAETGEEMEEKSVNEGTIKERKALKVKASKTPKLVAFKKKRHLL